MIIMSFSPRYAEIYDTLHAEKDYRFEDARLRALFKEYRIPCGTILDYGCGTGNHARHLASWCREVIGVDPNEAMLEIAGKKTAAASNIRLLHARDQETIPARSIDACVALFDVLSYMNRDEEIKGLLHFLTQVLRPKALFVFDFWYGPAVLHLRPEAREKNFEMPGKRIQKKVHPVLDENRRIVSVTHEITVIGEGEKREQFSDEHSMRYFSEEEIGNFLKRYGFSILKFGTWKNLESPPRCEDWSALAVSRFEGKA